MQLNENGRFGKATATTEVKSFPNQNLVALAWKTTLLICAKAKLNPNEAMEVGVLENYPVSEAIMKLWVAGSLFSADRQIKAGINKQQVQTCLTKLFGSEPSQEVVAFFDAMCKVMACVPTKVLIARLSGRFDEYAELGEKALASFHPYIRANRELVINALTDSPTLRLEYLSKFEAAGF